MNEPMYIEERHRTLEPARRVWVENVSLLMKYKWLILGAALIVSIATGVYLFGFAKIYYKSTANVLPARKPGGGALDNLAAGISSTIKDLGLTQIAGRSKADGVYSPLALIDSRELHEQIVREFDLVNVYEVKTARDAADIFSDLASLDVLEEGNIAVSFEDTDPVRAAAIANRLVRGLNEINSRLAIEEARFNKAYVDARWAKLMSDLDSAERALGDFQKKYGVYELKEQAAAQLSLLSTLETQRFAAEVQLRNAEQLYGSQAPETQVLRTQVDELNGKLYDIKRGMDRSASSYFVPMDVLPNVALDYLRLMREVEIQSKLKAFLLPTYEQSKLDENRQTLLYIVLDSAIVPQHKSRPKRASILFMTFAGTAALTAIGLVALTNFRTSKAKFKRDQQLLNL